MTLAYLGPHYSGGGLVVPIHPEQLHPLLAEAVVCLRASSVDAGNYSDGDDWPNEGTSGVDAAPNALDPESDLITQPAYFHDGDGLPAVRFFSPMVADDEEGSGQANAPHASAEVPTAGFFICGKGRAVAPAHGVDNYQGSGEPQYHWVLTKKGVLIEDDHNLNLGVRDADGAIWVGWWGTAEEFDNHEHFLGSGLDVYKTNEVAGSLVCDDGDGHHVVTAYVRDDADPDLTVGGKGWRIVDQEVVDGTTDIRDDPELDWQAFDGRGFFSYVEWYSWDGTTATPILACRPSTDATPGSGPGDTFQTGGVTWTLGATTAVVDATDPGFCSGAALGYGRFTVADHAALKPGTGDFTEWFLVVPTFSPAEDDNTPIVHMGKVDGVPGAGGVGWMFQDLTVPMFGLAGLNFVFSDGTNTSLVTGAVPEDWVGNPHLVVLRRVGGTGSVFIDGEPFGTAIAATATGSLDNVGDLILLDGAPTASIQIGRSYGHYDRALTDTEITETLPAALGLA